MNASVAIQVLPKVDSDEEVIRVVDEVIAYIKERIEKGRMYGAFVNDELAGMIGVHNDDSIGMLYVYDKFRGRRIGTALQTYMINKMIDLGWRPYSQIMVGDEASTKIQRSLNMFLSKTPIIWMGQD